MNMQDLWLEHIVNLATIDSYGRKQLDSGRVSRTMGGSWVFYKRDFHLIQRIKNEHSLNVALVQ